MGGPQGLKGLSRMIRYWVIIHLMTMMKCLGAAGPVTPGGPWRPQGSEGVKALTFSCTREDLAFAVESALTKPARSASTRAADEVGVEEDDEEVVFDDQERGFFCKIETPLNCSHCSVLL